jgi:hypothetical protein
MGNKHKITQRKKINIKSSPQTLNTRQHKKFDDLFMNTAYWPYIRVPLRVRPRQLVNKCAKMTPHTCTAATIGTNSYSWAMDGNNTKCHWVKSLVVHSDVAYTEASQTPHLMQKTRTVYIRQHNDIIFCPNSDDSLAQCTAQLKCWRFDSVLTA